MVFRYLLALALLALALPLALAQADANQGVAVPKAGSVDLNSLSPAAFCEAIKDTLKPTFDCDSALGHPVCIHNYVFDYSMGKCRSRNLLDSLNDFAHGRNPGLLSIDTKAVYFRGNLVTVHAQATDGTPIQGAAGSILFPNGETREVTTDASGIALFPAGLRGPYVLQARKGDAVASTRFTAYRSIFEVNPFNGDLFALYNDSMEANSGIMIIFLLLVSLLTALLFNGNALAYFFDSPLLPLLRLLALLSFFAPLAVAALFKMGSGLLFSLAEFAAVFAYFRALASDKPPNSKAPPAPPETEPQ